MCCCGQLLSVLSVAMGCLLCTQYTSVPRGVYGRLRVVTCMCGVALIIGPWKPKHVKEKARTQIRVQTRSQNSNLLTSIQTTETCTQYPQEMAQLHQPQQETPTAPVSVRRPDFLFLRQFDSQLPNSSQFPPKTHQSPRDVSRVMEETG